MDTHSFGYTLCIILLSVTRCLAVEWSESNVEATQGDDVTITCSAKLSNAFDIIRVVWVNETEGGSDVVITDNDSLKDWTLETGRYNVEVDQDTDALMGELELSYFGIRGEDGGKLACYALSDESQKAYVTLNVKVPVKELYIERLVGAEGSTRIDTSARDSVILSEREDIGVACVAVVDGSNEKPKMMVMLGEKDITADFKEEVLYQNMMPLGESMGLPTKGVTIKMKYQTKFPDPSFNNKELKCMTETELEKKTAAVQLIVKYSPSITCEEYQVLRLPGETAEFHCDLMANPGPSLEWHYMDGEEQKPVQDIPSNETIETQTEIINSDHIKATLKIPTVEDLHFTSYIIKAHNDIGEKEMIIELSKGKVEVVILTEKPTTKTVSTTDPSHMTTPDAEEQDFKTEKIVQVDTKDTETGASKSGSSPSPLLNRLSFLPLFVNCVLLVLWQHVGLNL